MQHDRICLVHLARRENGLPPFERFVAAYRANEPGIAHDLLLLYKGFREPQDLAPYRDVLGTIGHLEQRVPDSGYDIGSYVHALRRYQDEYGYFCFLNSFAEPLHAGWLAHLWRQASRPDAGIAGATGSYQSIAVQYHQYAHARQLRYGRTITPLMRPLLRAALAALHVKRLVSFAPFPNPHVRTNAFIAPTAVLARLQIPPIRSKMHAYRFESGRQGLTRQVLKLGRKALLVGADGAGVEIAQWPESNVFWRAAQENLLVADNQTRLYRDGEPRQRAVLSYYAWGDRAWPDASALAATAPAAKPAAER